MSERDLYYAVWNAQQDGKSLEAFLEDAREMWLSQRSDQLHRERNAAHAARGLTP